MTEPETMQRARMYLTVYYSASAQRFLLDHLDEILK